MSPRPDCQPLPTRGTPARVKVTSGLSFASPPPKAWATGQSIPVWWKSGWRRVLRKMESRHGPGEVLSEVESPRSTPGYGVPAPRTQPEVMNYCASPPEWPLLKTRLEGGAARGPIFQLGRSGSRSHRSHPRSKSSPSPLPFQGLPALQRPLRAEGLAWLARMSSYCGGGQPSGLRSSCSILGFASQPVGKAEGFGLENLFQPPAPSVAGGLWPTSNPNTNRPSHGSWGVGGGRCPQVPSFLELPAGSRHQRPRILIRRCPGRFHRTRSAGFPQNFVQPQISHLVVLARARLRPAPSPLPPAPGQRPGPISSPGAALAGSHPPSPAPAVGSLQLSLKDASATLLMARSALPGDPKAAPLKTARAIQNGRAHSSGGDDVLRRCALACHPNGPALAPVGEGHRAPPSLPGCFRVLPDRWPQTFQSRMCAPQLGRPLQGPL